jgi:hypothetical protein
MARKKKELFPIEGYPWDKESTPWGQEADFLSNQSSEPFELCRDFIILSYLEYGDSRPLAALIMIGEAPGPAVLRYMAGMMGAPSDVKHLDLPFELSLKGRNGRKPKDRELEWRNFLLSRNVEKEMASGKKYEHAAVPDIASLTGLGEQTVRDAYDKYHPKKATS